MQNPSELPRSLVAEIGTITAIWAYIEQDLILHASAMAAQDTDGHPIEYLRMDFKRLREKWYRLCRERFTKERFDKVIHPINTDLAQLSIDRGHVVHSMWEPLGRGRFAYSFWEQKDSLMKWGGEMSLKELRALRMASQDVLDRLRRFLRFDHRPEDTLATFGEVTDALIPSDKR